MKTARKFLVVLLSLALLVSAFAMVASAEETGAGETPTAPAKNYEEVLEYFEAGYFLNADFNDAATKEDAFADATDEFVLAVDKVFKYTDNKNGTASMQSMNPAYFDIIPEESTSFGINARFSLAANNSPYVSLVLHTGNRGDKSDKPINLFSISAGSITIYNDETGAYVTETVELPRATFFDVEFFFDASKTVNNCVLKVTVDGVDAPYEYVYSTGSYVYKTFGMESKFITADYLEIYKGTFSRQLAGFENVVADYIVSYAADYETLKDSDPETAVRCLEIIGKILLTYNFDTAKVTDETVRNNVVAVGSNAIKVVGNKYVEIYKAACDAINTEAAYNDRLDHVNSAAVYNDFLKKAENGIYAVTLETSYDDIAAMHAVYEAEIAALEQIKADTIEAYTAISAIPDVYLANFKDLKNAYAVISEKAVCPTFYDDVYTVEVIEAAVKAGAVIISEYERLDAKLALFVENAGIAADESKQFADRYAAYLIAKENYFTDSSCNEFLAEGVTIEVLLASYEAVNTVMVAVSDYAEAFIAKVDEAKLTLSYSVRQEAVAKASTYIETVERQYPGVSESIATYEALLQDIEDRIKATEDYIKAAIAIQSADTIEAKKAAIATAKALAVNGSDVSVDVTYEGVTVKDANIILSNEESVIVLAETKITNYVAAVNAISAKYDLAERRAAIVRALELKENVDPSVAAVSSANASLDAYIASYNADVTAANDTVANAAEVTLSVLSGTIPTQQVAQIVAIIKKVY